MPEILLKGFRCGECGHGWVPRVEGRPSQCPGCRSSFWDNKPREKKPRLKI